MSSKTLISFYQVFQRIDIVSKDFDNIVDLQIGAPWPLPPIELTATLAHKFELIGSFPSSFHEACTASSAFLLHFSQRYPENASKF